MFFDWLEKRAPQAHLIRYKTKANHDLVTCIYRATHSHWFIVLLTFIETSLVWFSYSQHLNKLKTLRKKNSSTYSLICVLIFSARAQLLKGRIEYEKGDFRNALSCYTEGIELKCKDDELNASLYLARLLSHKQLGEFTRLFVFRFSLVS